MAISNELMSILDRQIESVDAAIEKADKLLKQREEERNTPKTGETWYVKINGNLTLSEAGVIETTSNTVLLRFENTLGYNNCRYEKQDVKFVEKLS